MSRDSVSKNGNKNDKINGVNSEKWFISDILYQYLLSKAAKDFNSSFERKRQSREE